MYEADWSQYLADFLSAATSATIIFIIIIIIILICGSCSRTDETVLLTVLWPRPAVWSLRGHSSVSLLQVATVVCRRRFHCKCTVPLYTRESNKWHSINIHELTESIATVVALNNPSDYRTVNAGLESCTHRRGHLAAVHRGRLELQDWTMTDDWPTIPCIKLKRSWPHGANANHCNVGLAVLRNAPRRSKMDYKDGSCQKLRNYLH